MFKKNIFYLLFYLKKKSRHQKDFIYICLLNKIIIVINFKIKIVTKTTFEIILGNIKDNFIRYKYIIFKNCVKEVF